MGKKTYAASDGPSFSSTPPAPRQSESQSPVIESPVENEYHQEPAAVKLQEESSLGGGGLRSILTDQTKFKLGVTALAAAGLLNLYSPRYNREGARVIRSCVDRIFLGRRPSLIRESSRLRPYPWSGILSTRYASSLAHSFSLHNDQGFGDVILNPSLQKRMQQLASAPPFRRNLLFYGPQGTGKKMAARELANRCGLDYALVSGDHIAPLGPQEAVTIIHELFDWSNKSRKGLLLFIDEADALLSEYWRGHKPWMSEAQTSAPMNALFSRTGNRSNDTVLVLAISLPGQIDSAVAARIDESLQFPLPGVEERFRLLKLYLDKYIAQLWFNNLFKKKEQKIEIKGLTDDVIREAADKTKGLSGIQIASLMRIVERIVYQNKRGVLDPALFLQGVAMQRSAIIPICDGCWHCSSTCYPVTPWL